MLRFVSGVAMGDGYSQGARASSAWGLREAALPLLYAASLSSLAAAFALELRGSPAALPVWMGTVVAEGTALFVLDLIGVRLFTPTASPGGAAYLAEHARTLRGYSLARRGYYLGQAAACWVVCGTATVVLAAWLGAALRAHVGALGAAGEAVARVHPAIRLLVSFVVLDLWSYGRHRLEHAGGERGALYRWVHRWHHVPRELNMYTGSQVHPVESVLVFAVPCLVFSALGWERWELLFLFTLFLVVTAPQHMNSGFTAGPLGRIVHGPEAHGRHHSARYEERNANFADCLAVWDHLFGTYAPPKGAPFEGPFGPGEPRPPA